MTTTQGHVLLVDDQPANLEVLSQLLGERGYRVRGVTSGERAIEAARLLPPECILLDVAMPGMDGFETCRALVAIPELSAVPVIFITALDEAELKLRAFSAGGRDYVTKPFQSQEVIARVETHVRIHRMERELREQNSRLASANAQLEQLQVLRSRMSAMLVHDLKSPLMVIGSFIDLPDDLEIQEYARSAHGKMLKLVHEMLEIYKSEHQSAAERKRTPLDLGAVVAQTVNSMRAAARRMNVVIEQSAGERPLVVLGDAADLDRVLANLLDNALKYTQSGGSVFVSTGEESGTGVESGLQFAAVTITDTGPGIAPEDLPYVFDAYRQHDANGPVGSVGLGLAIVQRLVALHGGRVRVYSQLGVGTTFRVLLPFVALH